MHVPVASSAAPTLADLRMMTGFMRSHTSGAHFVYLHDDAGGGRAVTAASMLLLLKGDSWQTVQGDMTTGELSSISSAQSRAIGQLTSALAAAGRPLSGNPYSGARISSW